MLRHIPLFLVFLVSAAQVTRAQSHFTDCATRTGSSATILIPSTANVTLNGSSIPDGSELAAFTQDGICAGVIVWNGEPTGFPIWGDDSQTGAKDGFDNGEAMTYRLWDAVARSEYDGAAMSTTVTFSNEQPFYTSENTFAEDGIYELSSFEMETLPTDTEKPEVPDVFAVHPNYPNPFNPSTTIRYDLPERDNVRITIYSATGAQVEVLVNQIMPQGSHEFRWDATSLPSGTYFCRVETRSQSDVQSLTLLK